MTLPVKFGQPAYRLYRLVWTGLDWLYPPYCGGCGKRGIRWCLDCSQRVQRLMPPFCPSCGAETSEEAPCTTCEKISYHYSAVRSVCYYDGPIRQAILGLKYKGDMGLGEALASDLINLFCSLRWNVDVILPVPIGMTRQAERGYNQAALLAVPLALATETHYESKALRKVRLTRSQVGLSREERVQNVAGAFHADSKIVANQRILVVDDVMTTGATLDACAVALKNAGAGEVYCLTLARAHHYSSNRGEQNDLA